MNLITLLLFVEYVWFRSSLTNAVGNLTSSPDFTSGVLTVCPGTPISFVCTHDNVAGEQTRWEVAGPTPCAVAVIHRPPTENTCGPFTITMASDDNGTTLMSTAQTTVTEALDGAVVVCRAGGPSSSPQVGNITISVLDIPTPNVSSIEQISQSMVRVNLTVDNDQCAASYHVHATLEGGSGSSTSSNSSISTVDVSGLDLCQYNYSIVGSIRTAGGVQSNLSSPVSFTVDLSVVNGVDNLRINQENSVLKWDQIANPLYPTCITGYLVATQDMTYSTTVNSTSVTRGVLNGAGFPYCQILDVGVTPFTPMGPLTGRPSFLNLTLYDPDFADPMLSDFFTIVNEIVVLTVSVQNISDAVVPTRLYQYTNSSGTMSALTPFTGISFEIKLPGVEDGQTIPVTVTFENKSCSTMTSSTFTVPNRTISIAVESEPSSTSFTVTLTLPLTAFPPGNLSIISSLNPPDVDPTITNFTGPSMQHMVTFSGLTPGTDYTYTIRIVHQDNTTVDVVPPVTGAFSTMSPPTMTTLPPTTTPPETTTTMGTTSPPSAAPVACGAGCIAGIIMAAVVVVVLIVIIIVVVVIAVKSRRSKYLIRRGTDQSSSQPPTELREPIYDEPEDIDPHTQENSAYGHIQPLSSRQ